MRIMTLSSFGSLTLLRQEEELLAIQELFVTGLSANSVLMEKPIVKQLTEKVRHDYELFGHPVHEFGEFTYKAGSWDYYQRLVVELRGDVEALGFGEGIIRCHFRTTIRQLVGFLQELKFQPLYFSHAGSIHIMLF